MGSRSESKKLGESCQLSRRCSQPLRNTVLHSPHERFANLLLFSVPSWRVPRWKPPHRERFDKPSLVVIGSLQLCGKSNERVQDHKLS